MDIKTMEWYRDVFVLHDEHENNRYIENWFANSENKKPVNDCREFNYGYYVLRKSFSHVWHLWYMALDYNNEYVSNMHIHIPLHTPGIDFMYRCSQTYMGFDRNVQTITQRAQNHMEEIRVMAKLKE